MLAFCLVSSVYLASLALVFLPFPCVPPCSGERCSLASPTRRLLAPSLLDLPALVAPRVPTLFVRLGSFLVLARLLTIPKKKKSAHISEDKGQAVRALEVREREERRRCIASPPLLFVHMRGCVGGVGVFGGG